jgi:hypothetical protein
MMPRKIVLALGLLTFLAFGTSAKPLKLMRFTVVNRSMLPIELSLTGENIEDNEYYLRVAKGIPENPTTQVFTVLPDKYSVTVYYVEYWDPVYGTVCGSKSQEVDLTHNTRLLVPICTHTPPNGGEPAMLKLGGRSRSGGRHFPR